MRTTLTLEPEVARRVESELRRTGKTLKAVINDAIKAGLGIGPAPRGARPPFKVQAWPLGLQPGVDPNRLNQLVDELEVAAYLEKNRR